MTTYESDIQTISSSEEMVFGLLSDMNNLEKIRERASQSKQVKELEFDSDSVRIQLDGIGKLGFRIIERTPNSTIKYELEDAPIKANAWVQLKPADENSTYLKLTLKADLPFMIKTMLDKKLKEGINTLAEGIAKAFNQQADNQTV